MPGEVLGVLEASIEGDESIRKRWVPGAFYIPSGVVRDALDALPHAPEVS